MCADDRSEPGLDRSILILIGLVKAYETPDDTGTREPVFALGFQQGLELQHPELPADLPKVDEMDLAELEAQGLIDVTHGRGSQKIVPTARARKLAAQVAVAMDDTPAADLSDFVAAVESQALADNKLAWDAVRPVLESIRRYWEDSGFPDPGVCLRPLLSTVPDGTESIFGATVKKLLSGGYLDKASDIEMNGLPSIVSIGDRTLATQDGWPGATGQDLFENLIAVLAEQAQDEADPDKKKKLERTIDAIQSLGTSTAAGVLTRVFMG